MKTTKPIALSAILILLVGIIFTSCSKREGCTDPAATNFDVEAKKDDGSCSYETPTVALNDESYITFNFTHHFDGIPVTAQNFNQFNFVTANGDTISITKLRYLVSDMKLYTSLGDSIVMEGHNMVDVTNGTGLSYSAGKSSFGGFAGIGFTLGFDTTDNNGNYVDLNSASWSVPTMMGGGYHGMQFEGKYKLNGNDSTFAYHHICNKRPNMTAPFEANHINIGLPGIALNERNVVVEIRMNIADWFKNPNTWDLNNFHASLMGNYTAQSMMKANGYNVFSLGSVSQRVAQ